MFILSSNFAPLMRMLVWVPIILLLLALVSFIPASRGHWSALILAAPAVLLGLLLAASIVPAGPRVPPGACCLFISPPVVGILSVGLWAEMRKHRKE